MKRLLVLIPLLLLLAAPSFAQASQTYTLDSGTSIAYPSGWSVEQNDALVVLSRGNFSRAIVIDYPLVDMLTLNVETTLANSLLALGREVLNVDINTGEIEDFVIAERDAARWDTRLNGGPATLVAVNFQNGGIGMLLTVGVSDGTLVDLLTSFDNLVPMTTQQMPTTRNSVQAQVMPRLFFFEDGARFTFPANWTGSLQRISGLDAVSLQAPQAAVDVLMINLLGRVPNDASMNMVLEIAALDFSELGLRLRITDAIPLTLGDHEAVRYYGTITVDGETVSAELTITQYSERGYGLMLAYGEELAQARADLEVMAASFNNSLYGIDTIN